MAKQHLEELIKKLHKANTQNKIEGLFLEIATHLMNELCINAGGKKYRITVCEIYYDNGESHQDPYLYRHEKQNKMLHWCFHYSGIDLTIGDNDQKKGGILIREVHEIREDIKNAISKPLDGPLKLLLSNDSILNNILGDAFTGERHLYLGECKCGSQLEKPSLEGRIGLDEGNEIILEEKWKIKNIGEKFFGRKYHYKLK